MKSISKLTLALACGMSVAPFTLADDSHHSGGTTKVAASSSASAAMSEGEVKKVDKSAGKVTIKHGPLKNLDMPGMTMAFRVKDPAMLDQVKAGDKINFVADKSGEQFVVTKIQVNNK